MGKRSSFIVRAVLVFMLAFSFGPSFLLTAFADDSSQLVTKPVPLVPGAASVTGLSIASTIDGTDFTATDGPGLDSAGDNNICRTFDTVTYTLAYSTALKAEAGNVAGFTEGDVFFKGVIPNATLAEVAFDTASMSWANDVSQVQQGSDVVITGKRHVTSGSLPSCIPGMGTLSIPVLVKASYQGQTYTPQFSVWLDGDQAAGTKSVTAHEFTVSSTPTMNVAMSLAQSSKVWGAQTSSQGTPLGDGLIQDFTTDIEVGSTTTSKGSEAPARPITFDLVLSGYRIDGADTPTATTVPLAVAPDIAYIEDEAGQATITYEKTGNGLYKVTVSNYAIPELSINTATPIPIVSLKVGVFQGEPQGQPKVIPDDKNFEIIVQDNNLAATGASGEAIPAATAPTFLDNQTDDQDDRSLVSYNNLTGKYYVGAYLTPELFNLEDYSVHELTNSVNGMSKRYNLISATGNREYAPGSLMTAVSTSYSQPKYNPFNSAATALTGADCLFKFDDKTMQIPENEQWEIMFASASDEQLAQIKTTIRYVAKPDGTGWTDWQECADTNMRGLKSYASLDELENDGAVCVGVVLEVRDFSYYTNSANSGGLLPFYRLQVKQNPQLAEDKETGWMCYNNRLYTEKNYTPTIDEHMEYSSTQQAFLEYGVANDDSWESWPADVQGHHSWEPSHYNEDGTRNAGLSNGLFGDSFFIVSRGVRMNYAIESQDEGGAIKTVYDVSAGDEKVDLVLTPNVTASDDSPMSASYRWRIYDTSPLVPGSAVLGGTYNPATGQVEGGTPVELTKGAHNAAGYTIYTLDFGSIRPSELVPLHISLKIPSDTTTNGQSFASRAWLYYGEENASPTLFDLSATSYSAVKVGDIRFTKTVETENATAPTDTQASAENGLTYDIGMENTSAIAITDMKALDILPYNGDLMGSDFTGTYKVKPVTLDTAGQSIAGNGIKVYYTTDTAVQSPTFNAGTVDVTDGTWTEVPNTGTDTMGTFAVAENATAVVVTGQLPVKTTFHLKIPFDTTDTLGSLGNGASVASPDVPNEENLININGTSTEVIRAVNVTNTLTNIVTNNTAVTTPMGEDYTEKLTAKPGYRLPDTITVKVGNTELTPAADPTNPVAGEYIYDPETGNVTVPGVSTTDDIEVIAEAVKQVKLTNTLTNISSNKPTKETVDANSPYTETLTASPGYELPDTITVNVGGTPVTVTSGTPAGGITYDKTTGTVTFDNTVITGDTQIIAEAVPVKYTVKFETETGGTLSGSDDQSVDYKGTATAGATATPDATHVFLGWDYDYVGVDGVHYSGTTTDYTTIPIMNDITFTAKYASLQSVSAIADHGYVTTAPSATPPTTDTNTNATSDLVDDGTGKHPSSVAFEAQDYYKVGEKIAVYDKDGNKLGEIDPTLSTPQTITDGVNTTTVTVTQNEDGTAGTIVCEDQSIGFLKYEIPFAPQEYKLTNTLSGLTGTQTTGSKVTYGTDFTETLIPSFEPGKTYQMPETITVKVDGTELTPSTDPANPLPGQYGYDPETGKVIIPGAGVTGDVQIIAQALFAVENQLTNIVTDNPATTVGVGETYTETLSPEQGFRNPDAIKVSVAGVEYTIESGVPNNGITYDKTTGVVTVDGSVVNGDIKVVAEAVATTTVESTVTNGYSTTPDGSIDMGKDFTTTLVPNSGYQTPDSITLTIDGVEYTIENGVPNNGITYDKTTGAVFVPGSMVTGPLVINAVMDQEPTPPTPPTPPSPVDPNPGPSTEQTATPLATGTKTVTANTGDNPIPLTVAGVALLGAAGALVLSRNRRKNQE